MRIAPTALGTRGALLFLAIALAFFATPYSNLFFLLLVFLVVLTCAGLFGAVNNLRGVAVEVLPASPAAADAVRPLQLRLRGPGRHWQLELVLPLSDRDVNAGHCTLLDRETATIATLPPLPRGVERITSLAITSRYPFGLFAVRRTVPIDLELVTHPSPLPIEPSTAPDLHDALAGRMRRGGADAVVGVRPWRTGDALRQVSWKASARRRELVVRECETDDSEAIEVVFDLRASEPAFEHALRLLCGIVLFARDAKRHLTLVTCRERLTFGPGQMGYEAALRWLAAARRDGLAPAPPTGAPGAVLVPATAVAP